MNAYVILMRGINVGGKNKVPMAGLRKCLEELGFSHVSTYIASGNAILKSNKDADEIKAQIEEALPKSFKLDNEIIKVLVLTLNQLQAVIDNKPEGFGEQPEKYHSDTIFLMGIESAQAMLVFNPRQGVDKVWPGDGVIYSQRLSSQRTKSRLSKIMATPAYKSMTIRHWSTTTKLLKILEEAAKEKLENKPMQKQHYLIEIKATRERIWNILWEDKAFRDWGNIIDEGQYMVGEIKEGNEVQFISSVSGYGVKSLIEKLVPNEFVSFRQGADTKDHGKREREKEWTGGKESYSLVENNNITTLRVNIDVPPGQEETFKVRFPKALERVKFLAEKKD